jgi:hypothetical protein
LDVAINGERFRAYVKQMLAPTVRPDDIVLLDSLSSHKAAGVAEAITAEGRNSFIWHHTVPTL